MIVEIECSYCCRKVQIQVNKEDYERYNDPNNEQLIQEIFPYLSADDREILISKVCGKCFDDLMVDYLPECYDDDDLPSKD